MPSDFSCVPNDTRLQTGNPEIRTPDLPLDNPQRGFCQDVASGRSHPPKCEHIKDSVVARGDSEQTAEEIAARTVNKDRAQHGESVQASASSLNDMPAGRRGGLRSHSGARGRTLAQLRSEATQRRIKGRSRMIKAQLEQALGQNG